MKILIVDDNEVIANLLQELLSIVEDYQVETAGNGMEGYATYLRFKPDIILSDIEMPVKNGIEMIKDIRKHDNGIKTIYMSGHLNRYREKLEKEKTEYQTDYLMKPLHFSEVIFLLHEYQKETGIA